jgi:hypothetical protein
MVRFALTLTTEDPAIFGAADIDIGRILAQATGAEYQGSTEKDLAAVIEELSGYF